MWPSAAGSREMAAWHPSQPPGHSVSINPMSCKAMSTSVSDTFEYKPSAHVLHCILCTQNIDTQKHPLVSNPTPCSAFNTCINIHNIQICVHAYIHYLTIASVIMLRRDGGICTPLRTEKASPWAWPGPS